MMIRLLNAAINLAMFLLPALLLAWADRPRAAGGRR